MPKALQCPTCEHKHPVTGLPDAATFGCEGCGRSLKIPGQFRAVAPPTPKPTAAPPVPVVRHDGNGDGRAPRTEAIPAPTRRDRRQAAERARTEATDRRRLPWWARLLSWVIAFPVGLFLTVWPARQLGFLSGQRLLDVLVGTGIGRYWRVLVIAPVWALVTTILVQLLQMAFRRLGARRQRIQEERVAATSRGAAATSDERAAPRDRTAAGASRP